MSDDKPTLYLAVTEERSDGYFHLRAHVTTDRHDGGQRLPYGISDSYHGPYYSRLTASCQGDERSRQERGVYAFGRLEYRDVHSVELNDAGRMFKTLGSLERGLAKLASSRGPVRSYGEYVGRLAEVLKCKGIAVQSSREAAAVSGRSWGWYGIGEGVAECNHRIYRWQQEDQAQAS